MSHFFRDIDWHGLRPMRGWVLAKADPRAKRVPGGLFLPDALTGIEKVSVEAATVLKVGSEVEKLLGTPVRPGDRFAYRGFVKDLTWYMLAPAEDGTTVFLLRAEDMLCLVEPGVEIGAYSGLTKPAEIPADWEPWDPMKPITANEVLPLHAQGKTAAIWDHDLGRLLPPVLEARLSEGWVDQAVLATDLDSLEAYKQVSEKYGYVHVEEDYAKDLVRVKRFGRFSAYVKPQ